MYRLDAAIKNQLDDPARIQAVKQALHSGLELHRQGQEQFDQVVKLNPKSMAVQVGALRWRVGYNLLALTPWPCLAPALNSLTASMTQSAEPLSVIAGSSGRQEFSSRTTWCAAQR